MSPPRMDPPSATNPALTPEFRPDSTAHLKSQEMIGPSPCLIPGRDTAEWLFYGSFVVNPSETLDRRSAVKLWWGLGHRGE